MIKPKKAINNIITPDEKQTKTWRLKLDKNENIYGLSNTISSTIKNFFAEDIIFHSDDSNLIEKFALKYEIKKENILFSPNAHLIISNIIDIYLEANEEFLCYEYHPKIIDTKTILNEIQVRKIKLNKNSTANIQDIRANTKIFYLESPNHQTGDILKASMLEDLLNSSPATLFIIDCSYVNYSYQITFEDYIDLVKTHENLVLIKSYSKDYAIAGLNANVVVSNENIISNLKKINSQNTINSIAINCITTSLNENKKIEEIKELNQKAKEFFEANLINLGFDISKSEGNYLLCNFGNYCNFYYGKFEKNGIITKNYPINSSLESHLRITIPTIGGIKYILELLNKKDVLIIKDLDLIFDESNELIISKNTLENLSKKYDLVILSQKKEKIINELLENFEIDKYFYLSITQKDSDPTPEEITEIAKNCPNKSIKFISTKVNDIIAGNIANIETVGVISDYADFNLMMNNFKHIGAKNIITDKKDIEDFFLLNKNKNENLAISGY